MTLGFRDRVELFFLCVILVVIASPFIWIYHNWGEGACFLIFIVILLLWIHAHHKWKEIDNKHYDISIAKQDGTISDEEWAEYEEWADIEDKADVIEASYLKSNQNQSKTEISGDMEK